MKDIQFCVSRSVLKIAIAALGIFSQSAYANFQDNNNPDPVDRYLVRESRFGGDDSRGARPTVVKETPQSISASSFGPSEMGGAGRAPASVLESDRAPAALDPAAEARIKAGAEPNLTLSEIQKRGGVQEVAIISNDLGFFPSNIVLTKGIPARIYLSGTGRTQGQCFMLDEFKIRRQIKPGKVEEIQIQPEEEGKFSFHCPMNGAKGNILVKAIR